MSTTDEILNNQRFSHKDLAHLISLDGAEREKLFAKARKVTAKTIGDKVFYRGLVEFSNICTKDCLYCGIRKGNNEAERYDIDDDAILEAAKFAHSNKYGSIVLQSGERSDPKFIQRVGNLLKKIKKISNNELGITISLGEQSLETYKYWFDCGAHRYLLRIESSNEELYYKIHPKDANHDYQTRIKCLENLKTAGYQTGTGVMIGLPFQNYDDLANDLIFMKTL